MKTFDHVEVQNTLTGDWSAGFEVVMVERTDGGDERLRLRRHSDGFELPAAIPGRRVRAAHLTHDSWRR